MEAMVEIPKERLDSLLYAERVLAALKDSGVDNWEGYGEAISSVLDDE